MSLSGKKKIQLIKKQITICFFVFFILNSIHAQTADSVSANKPIDSTSVIKHSPKKATIMSAVLPGLGQIYNKKYWKVPVIYAGIATVGYFAVSNNQNYSKYKTAYKIRTDGDTNTIDEFYKKYTDQNLLDIKNYYRRNLEVTVIAGVALYALNIIDASVDAHLFDFEVNDDLSLNIKPMIVPNNTSFVSGLSLCLKIK
jgi:hypothetical protein